MPGTTGWWRKTRSRWFLLLLAGLVLWTILVLGMDNGIFGVYQDDGLYLTSARSLRDGRGFGLPSRPGEPPPKYPIGLPATLALLFRLDPRPPSLANEVVIARGLVAVGGWGFFLAAHAWLRRVGVGPALSCGIILATAFHHVVMIGGAITLFADLPFAAVTYALLARFAARPPGRKRDSRIRGAVDGALAGFAFLLRSNGITMIAASLVASALGKVGPLRVRPRAVLGCLVAVVVVVVPATWYAGRHPRVVPSNSYLIELKAGWTSPSAGMSVVAGNLRSVVFEFPTRTIASPTTYVDPLVKALRRQPALAWLIRGGFTAVVALGLIRLARASTRRDLPVWMHAVGTVAIFLIWPWNGIMDRFLLSLIPMVLLAFARGVESIMPLLPSIKADRTATNRLVAMTLAGVALGNGSVVLRAAHFFHTHGGQWPGAPDRVDQGRALELIRTRTEPDAVIASIWPEMVWLHADRTSVPILEDEAVMTGKFGDVSRLRLWIDLTRGRPFYLLHRTVEQDADHADDAQIAALTTPGSGLTTHLVAQTPSGHYRISRVIGSPEK